MERKCLKVAFGYQARVGKDTAAEYLKNKHGGVTLSFAAALYDIMNYAQGVCNFQKEKDRQFLQYIGSEWARTKEPDVWVNIVVNKIKNLIQNDPGVNIYITDVRFPNEFDALEKLGFILVNLRRDDVSRMKNDNSLLNHEVALHISETALIPYTQQGKWHFTIQNSGTKEEFYSKLDLL